jgi:hypothetical protein
LRPKAYRAAAICQFSAKSGSGTTHRSARELFLLLLEVDRTTSATEPLRGRPTSDQFGCQDLIFQPTPHHPNPAMEFEELSVGLVVQTDWDARPFRVLAFDRAEFLYDCWRPDIGGWGLQDLRGKAYYYRSATRLLLAHATAVRVDPLTDAERLVHRPDLPLRVLRFAELEWDALVTSSRDAFSLWLSASAPGLTISRDDVALDISVVALAPFGSKGGLKKPISITASNGTSFSSLELLWRAASIQTPIASELRHGVGIYRLGCSTGRPLFYLWGFHDRAGVV